MTSPLTRAPAGARLRVRLTPSAGRNEIRGFHTDPEGRAQLKVRVTAVPEKGKANKQLLKLLARSLKLPVSSLRLVSGETDRNKVIEFEGDPDALMRDLAIWIKGL